MVRYIIKKVSVLWCLLMIAVTIVFILLRVVPGDPVNAFLTKRSNASQVVEMRKAFGLDKPLASQYYRYLKSLGHLDFGRSYLYGKPVVQIFFHHLPRTLVLAVSAIFISTLLSLTLVLAAIFRPGSWLDLLGSVFAVSFLAIPNFLLGTLLIFLFAVKWPLFPISGSFHFLNLVLPALTLGLSMSAMQYRVTRSALMTELAKPYVRFARSKGLGPLRLFYHHLLRNIAIPLSTVLALQLGALVAGVIITETVFSWPGIGTILVEAVKYRDYPLVQGLVIWIVMGYLLIHFLLDIFYLWLDPRIYRKEHPQ